MKKRLPVGLVVEGSDAGSSLLDMPGVIANIGPVKSSSLRNARRFSNSLKAGRGVSAYEELASAEIVLLCAPDMALDRIIDELLSSGLELKRMSFLACGTWLSSKRLSALQLAGASVGTLLRVPGTSQPEGFVCEGDNRLCRLLRRMFDQSSAKLFQIKTDEKALYFAAEVLITTLPLPAFFAAQRALRQAGISGNPLASLIDQLTSRLLRNFRAGSRSHGGGPLASCSSATVEAYMRDLADKLPDVSRAIENHLASVETLNPLS